MPPVPRPVRKQRAAALREAGASEASRYFTGQIGQMVSLLTEADQSGHTEHFAPVRLALPSSPGVLMRARVTGSTDDLLLAEAA
jgi:threonylcarbamoyladenosine tRNA methylthiotransferase MtaB